MSRVTNVLVAVGIDNWDSTDIPPGILRMNAILESEANGQILTDINDCCGGAKNFEIYVFAAAFNHVPIDVIVNAAINSNWENPFQVQLMICEQDDYLFTVATVDEWKRNKAKGQR